MDRKKKQATRMAQCISCSKNVMTCGAGEDAEDKFGMCLMYISIFGRKSNGRKEGQAAINSERTEM